MQNKLIFEQRKLSTIDCRENLLSCLFDVAQVTDLQYLTLAPQYLHPKEQLLIKQRKKRLAKKEYLASRYIIKSLITMLHRCEFDMLNICFDEHTNKLYVFLGELRLPYHISVSHSKGLVFVVVTRDVKEIGVDLEYIDSKRQTRNLADNFFHPKEIELVRLNGELAFYKLWTMKEAVAKMRGQSVMSVLGDDMTHLSTMLYSSVGVYSGYAIAVVSSTPLDHFTVNILSSLVEDINE